ncbi:hypothetical protein IPF86_02335 [Candidatus Nomurabacteria bacterium]|jgi:hypothetical protein|nr:MAG: hypothetical protein IPF86_02335 [Candidatus Nomurabacteria bacterium]
MARIIPFRHQQKRTAGFVCRLIFLSLLITSGVLFWAIAAFALSLKLFIFMLGLLADHSVFTLQLLLYRIGVITIGGSLVLSFVIVLGVYRNNIKDYSDFLKGAKDAALFANIVVLPFYVAWQACLFIKKMFESFL